VDGESPLTMGESKGMKRDVRSVKLPPGGGYERYEVDVGFEPWRNPPFGRPSIPKGTLSEPFCRAVDTYGACGGLVTKVVVYPHGAALVCAYHGERDPSGQMRRYEVDETPVDWDQVPDALRADCFRALSAIIQQENRNSERQEQVAANYQRLLVNARSAREQTRRWIERAEEATEAIRRARSGER
jgi:hypothetical protein